MKKDKQKQLRVDSTDQQTIDFFVTETRAAIMTAIRPRWIVAPVEEVEQKYI
jgi:hypothetical protein